MSELIQFPCRVRYSCAAGDVVAVWERCGQFRLRGFWVEDAKTGKRLTPQYLKTEAGARAQLTELVERHGGILMTGEV